MPKYRVTVVEEDNSSMHHHGGGSAGLETRDVEVEALDSTSAKVEAKRVSGKEVLGEPVLVVLFNEHPSSTRCKTKM